MRAASSAISLAQPQDRLTGTAVTVVMEEVVTGDLGVSFASDCRPGRAQANRWRAQGLPAVQAEGVLAGMGKQAGADVADEISGEVAEVVPADLAAFARLGVDWVPVPAAGSSLWPRDSGRSWSCPQANCL